MAERICAHDWTGTPLGPIEGWPAQLTAAIDLMLAAHQPVSVSWGPDCVTLHNDGYIPILGGVKHPGTLGRPYREVWPEVWPEVWDEYRPIVAATMAGKAHSFVDRPVPLTGRADQPMIRFTFSWTPLRDAAGAVAGFLCAAAETTERVLAEKARDEVEAELRESEERQAFLLGLADTLRPLSDAIEIQAEVSRALGAHLRADRTYYSEIDDAGKLLVVRHEHNRVGTPSLVGDYGFEFLRPLLDVMRQGRPFVPNDVRIDPRLVALCPAYDALSLRSFVRVPPVRGGELVGSLGVADVAPRHWTEAEITPLHEVADRTWAAIEHARAEAALRESEARLRQFGEASSDVLWIRNAETLAMEYVSPAFEAIYGVGRSTVSDSGDSRAWGALIVPDDRAAALERLEHARRGKAVVHEFRIQRRSDGAFRWIRNHDFPLLDQHGRVQRIGGIATDVTEAKLLAEHQAVLLAELQHRVRNIMAVITSITARTGENGRSVSDYASLMAGRPLTLARVQALLTRTANVGASITAIVRDELAAGASHEGQHEISGPEIVLSPKVAEVLTLVVHELATNAVRYGALSAPGGVARVHWETFERRDARWLRFEWVEDAPERMRPSPPTRRQGFGTELIERRVPYELGGRGRVSIEEGGARCHLEFPLQGGASILETDAPKPTAVFGGAVDMTGEADLHGHRILVVEDDYYLANDTARALQGAGAEVLGPCSKEAAALDELAEAHPTGAVVDINLDAGPSFRVARALHERGVPFVFITGYDEGVIPPEFAGVTRLEKPVELRHLVASLATMLGDARP